MINTSGDENTPDDLIIKCQLSLDAKYIIIILKRSEEHYKIRVLSSKTFNNTLQIDLEGDYIKAEMINQNFPGKVFSVPYLKNGEFHMVIFTGEKLIVNTNLSKLANIKHYIRPNDNLAFPFMDMTFFSIVEKKNNRREDRNVMNETINNEKMFIAMFVPKLNEIKMLIYCYKTQSIFKSLKPYKLPIRNGYEKDFPIGCFFD